MTKDNDNIDQNQIKHICSTCLRIIADEHYILCTECKGFCQCLECYAYGMEIKNHVREHKVVLMDSVQPAKFSTDWSLEEELILLREIASCGIGNWVDISERVITKSAAECETHYFEIYCNQNTSPYPDCSQPPQDPLPLPNPLPFDTSPRPSHPSDKDETNSLFHNKTSPAVISGYMPKRHEFEDEFNDDIDHLINHIEFNETTTEQQLEEYCSLLELYNSQIIERTRRIKVIEEWGIQYLQFTSLGGSTVQDKSDDSKILPFAQYIGKENTEKLAKLLHKFNGNISKIQMRQKWQMNGVRTQSEGFFFNTLEGYVKDNRVPDVDIPKWNRAIIEHKQHPQSISEDEKLLSEKEMYLCTSENIKVPIYLSIKDLLIREYAARGRLSKNEVILMLPGLEYEGQLIYELLIDCKWISE